MTNTRILISRNKREGHYLGWRILGPSKRGLSWRGRNKPSHQRKGSEIMIDSLRERSKWRRAEVNRKWFPCTAPPERGGEFDLSYNRNIGVLHPVRIEVEVKDGKFFFVSGRIFLDEQDLPNWSWSEVQP